MFRTILCLFVSLFCCTAQPALSGFIPGFDPVWEKYGKKSASLLSPAGSGSGGAGFTDPTTGMEFVFVKGGCYKMGSNDGDADEKPVHEVCVDDFYMGKYEVTQGEWRKMMPRNPSHFIKKQRTPRCGVLS